MSSVTLFCYSYSMLSCGAECCLKSGGSDGGSGGSSGLTAQKPTAKPVPSSHRLPCKQHEAYNANCRNGGKCYVVLQRNVRTPQCRY